MEQGIKQFITQFKLREIFSGSTFLVTGGTGLIGATLIKCLVALNSNIRIIAPVRNIKKAIEIIGISEAVKIVECNLEQIVFDDLGPVDFIIHGASPTSSRFFTENPVETIESIFIITKHLLDYARKINIRGFVFLSSLEIYGQQFESKKISEKEKARIDILDVRSSYPLAKQLTENLCISYFHEYNVPVKIARLTQTTGPGVSKEDNRVIVQFVRRAINGEDITLNTTGESSRPYCYTYDAVDAILYILAKGLNGEAYNIANEATYISAKKLALLVREIINPEIKIKLDIRNDLGYAPITFLNLSTEAIQNLGWKPRYDLKEIIIELSKYLTTINSL